jgi:hypothetical protein
MARRFFGTRENLSIIARRIGWRDAESLQHDILEYGRFRWDWLGSLWKKAPKQKTEVLVLDQSPVM